MNNKQKDLTLYNAHFIDGLVKAGVESAVISPGSRSTPMALLLAEHPDIKVYVQIDERSAAFFALGLAKASGKPTALLCTSGTAAANYLPAVAEAKNARIPLIVLTSDRPHELREVGAPQSIDQNRLYGTHAKWFAEMALPDAEEHMLRYVRITAAKAVYIAKQSPAGPVHLNFPFREPLLPQYDGLFERLEIEDLPAIHLSEGMRMLPKQEIEVLAAIFKEKEKGLIVCGEQQSEGFEKAVVELAEKLGYPILADPLSGLRSGEAHSHLIIDSYDAFLRNEKIKQEASFDIVLRFGAMPVSKALTQFIGRHDAIVHCVVDSGGGWREPIGVATHMLAADESAFCQALSARLNEQRDRSSWLENWMHINQAAKTIMQSVGEHAELDEGKLFYEVLQRLPDHSALFVGNSMPIRDLDSFFFTDERRIRLLANRGANGIDGLVSSALGAAAVTSPLYLIVGDLSLFHDLNGLLAAKLNGINITVIVINNNGGGIFSYLPQAGEQKHFELLFGTPADLDFSHAAKLYGGDYERVTDLASLDNSMAKAAKGDGLLIIEAITDRAKNVVAHRELWEKVSQEMNKLTAGEGFWK
ncbi:2-succinyl-5-enolpyruvyl-6-hydroxy-3-cyclohexene-1-carboxylic-acid synthase [Pseudobacillus wudalianchiensis]|uniref:2-succinyl-5-enolpyruvyl-6-hydroxy-3-cyclohexene-1-carboxylate synthase n=1 Tax=Pseudobacillus wudalianchiensis TaxID=1743143 RepID=A0A1B9B7U5_9BACI|nr:2-succinyl-5-enolpyruvyl-6-hydroxy-3-cyclohexene-1-carboxylic-acid synthase [Bacillus wudalianchiensis]OCA92177.1 2-succinyl-5-enolpyruvyl-6-hydroxy-3-cyclohexene-1-carboxylic-acid synthase [Bacillus wudalianchiensis]